MNNPTVYVLLYNSNTEQQIKKLAYSLSIQTVKIDVAIPSEKYLPIFKQFSSCYNTYLSDSPHKHNIIVNPEYILCENNIQLLLDNPDGYLIGYEICPEVMDVIDDYGFNFLDNLKKKCTKEVSKLALTNAKPIHEIKNSRFYVQINPT